MSKNGESEYDDIVQEHLEMLDRKDTKEIKNLMEGCYSEDSRISMRKLWGLLKEREGKKTADDFFGIVLLYGRMLARQQEKELPEANAIGLALYCALVDVKVEETMSYIR